MAKRVKLTHSDLGYYQPCQRLNSDQVHFNLDNQPRKAYVPYETKDMVQISGPQDGNKRFGTLQLCLHPGPGKQPNAAMIFKGGGTVYEAEKDAYHPDVDVYFQEKAWFDKVVAEKWVKKTLAASKTACLPDKDFVLFNDNLKAQKDQKSYVYQIQDIRGQVAYGPPGKTEAWQPVDAGHKHHARLLLLCCGGART